MDKPQPRRRVWLITDTHFNHDKMVDMCGRPKDFNERIGAALARNCQEGDTLYHLGDVAFYDAKAAHDKWIAPLPCAKVLCLGNHDKKPDGWFRSNGWDLVVRGVALRMAGVKLFLSHYPTDAVPAGTDVHVHGHQHNYGASGFLKPYSESAAEIRYLLAIEHTKYAPILLGDVANQFKQRKWREAI